MTCKDSDECRANIINSICINNVCRCEDSHNLQDGNTCVATRILYCENDEECVEMNGVCVDGRCQCSVNYVLHESKCLQTKLEGRCRINSDCSALNFAQCIRGKCACGKGFFVLNAKACVKALGKSCISNKDCGVRFSSCYDKKCQCNHGYTQHSENQCRTTELGMTCFDNNTCILIKNAHSFESQCSCKENHIEMNALTCAPLLNAFCNNDLKCVPENSVCIDYKCQCEFSYFPNSNYECILMYLELQCRSDKDCSNIRFAKCSPVRKCVCHKNYVQTGRTTCSPTLGENYFHKGAQATGSALSSMESVTRTSVAVSQDIRSTLMTFVYLCSWVRIATLTKTFCDKISNAKCSHRKCQCKEGYTKFDRQVCLPLIGTRCTEHKECAVYNSNCIDNTCQCLETYIPQSQYECVPTGIDSICYNDDDCQAVNTHCSRFNYCICNTNFISVDNMTCATILGAHCRKSMPCITPNSGCIDNTCQCNQGFVRGPFNDCVSVTLGSACVINRDCKNISNAICIDKKCACKPDTFALTPLACNQLLNTTCSSSADCGIETSHCDLNKCQCKPDWMAITDTLCAKRSLLYHCDNALDCGEPWHSKCFQNRCVCNEHHIAVNELTCLPTLGGACWRDDQCMSDNTVCINYKCRCKHGLSQ
ncbi:uncharacterized protein LOC141532377 [Cotesia typhae]|uniref:uncharacterized protein LOC141532377 n=1 Tax=Cotesia typhae TaxID=2053667 RepID=UPI003D69EC02